MTTAAKPITEQSGHWYYPDGRACYQVQKKDGSGLRPTTISDARKLGLLPSVTTILGVLDKPALTNWKIEQAVLVSLTAPRVDGEDLDAFVYRVLHTERQQDQESQVARERGTEMHAALESLLSGRDAPGEILPWVEPVFQFLQSNGKVIATEKVLVGDGYAGRTDLIQDTGIQMLWDFKSAKKLPDPKKGAWSEHRLQAAAYAACINGDVRTGNIYISTVECGKFVICEHGPWRETYENGFMPLVRHWQWANDYFPEPIGIIP